MTRSVLEVLAVALVAATAVAHAGAHHSIAKFDAQRVVKVAGVVTRFRWINPHASIEIDGSGGSGPAAGRWVVEMQAPTTLMGEGWSRESLAAGDQVTVFAHPLREADPGAASSRALYVGAILPGGATLGRVEEMHTGAE